MLHLHRSERTEPLATGLAELLRAPLADPFATEVVAVPAQGVERWLAQRLSTVLGTSPGATDDEGPGDGVCAGVAFPSPGRLVAEALAAATGTDPRDDPWARPVWPLLQVVDDSLGEPWCAVLTRHLGAPDDDLRRGRRLARTAHLAGLFAAYGAHRPGMLRDWAAGRDTDGEGPLPDDLRWQAELWRRLRARLGPSPAERLEPACAVLRDEPERSELPERLSLFGPTRLATDALAVLAALAVARDVHLWLPHPSPVLWEALRGRPAGRRRAGSSATTATTAAHPLLRSLARDVRELQVRLPVAGADVHHPDAPRPATLLGALQAGLRDDVAPRPTAGLRADGTVSVHACHGPARQVEVLRELLLRLFEDDPGLEPRDVLVLCPDVETFAPLVQASFGLGQGLAHPAHGLRVRLADRSLRATNPLLDAVAALLDLAEGRTPASAVLDLAASPAVRRRFGLDDDDLERVRDWVGRSGVRWALDAEHRAPYGLSALGQGTWQAGLDRLLLGVTTAEDEPVRLGLALPLDDVDSSDVDLVGRLAELVDRLGAALDALRGVRPATDWARALATALDELTEVPEPDGWQRGQALRELAEAVEGADSPLRLPDVRALLADRLRGRPTRAGFRTGDLTVCTLVPMRSVPHRVVVLLGLDDGVFPRAGGVDGDDVLARDPRVGERDVRAEDRQLLLDAVLSAGERLLVLVTGADPVSGARRPPAVPVDELLDALEQLVPGAREQVVVRHPLQPYDPREFAGPVPRSFDPAALAGARRALLPRSAPPPRRPLPPVTGPVALDDLVAFAEHPVKAYLRQRLRLTLPGEDDEVEDGLSVGLDGLQEWHVGERLLAAELAGVDPEQSRLVEWLRGGLPPGPLGGRVLDRVGRRVGPIAEAARPHLAAPSRAVDVRLDVGGRVLSGTVPAVRGDAVVQVSYSSLSPRARARGWVLALVLAAAGEGGRSTTVGRRGERAATVTATAPPDALAVLEQVVDLHARALRTPLPMASRTSAAYAQARAESAVPEAALESAGRAWTSDVGGERDDRHHVRVWGERPALDVLLEEPPGADERWTGEPTRFGELARRFWEPVLEAEQWA